MAVPNPEEWINNLSLEKILDLDLTGFVDLFFLIIMIAIYSIVIFNFYRFIARRDCFKPTKIKYTRTVGALRYLFLYPFVSILFFIGFTLIFIFMIDPSKYSMREILWLAFAIVIAIRITAYYTEDLSKDVAKMLPFAILAIFLVDRSYFSFDAALQTINELPQFINQIIQFVMIIILVEWILRIALSIRYRIFSKKQETTAVEW
jgi:hypothetical protein